MFGLPFLLIALPFRVLFLLVRVLSELLEHAGHSRGRRRPRARGHAATGRLTLSGIARQRRFWQIVGLLVVVGVIGAHPVASMVMIALVLGAFLLMRRQKSQREAASQQRRDAMTEAQRAHAQAVAALRPEDIEWLRAAGWNGPAARETGTLAR